MSSIIPTTKIILTAKSHPQVFQYFDTDDEEASFVVQYVPQLERWMVTYPDSRIQDLAEAINENDGLLEALADTSIIELKTIITKEIETVKQTQLRAYLRNVDDVSRRLDNDVEKLTQRIQVQQIRKRIIRFVDLVYTVSANVEILRFFDTEMGELISISSSNVAKELEKFKSVDEFIKSVGYLNFDGTELLGIKTEVLTDVPDVCTWAIDNLLKHLSTHL